MIAALIWGLSVLPPFAPSQARADGVEGARLADVETCGRCHADVVAQWRTSAHAFASFSNPVYRLSIDRLRAEVDNKTSRFCGGCHDPALLVDNALDREVVAQDRRAHAGVTCRTCHSVVHTRPDGNASYTLTADEIPLPDPGVPGSREAHIARVAPAPLRTASLCASCHRVFLDETTGNAHHLPGQDDATPFLRSAYSGSTLALLDDPLPEKDCRGCHMPREEATRGDLAAKDGKVASHRFLGAHTWLAAMRGDDEQVERAAAFLRGAASIDVAAAVADDGTRSLPADAAPVVPGHRIRLDVVVRNLSVGHRFPGGTLDAQDTWIDVTVKTAGGRVLAVTDEADAHRLRALLVGDDGQPLLERQTHRFRAVVWNHTLLPRDAEVEEYALDVPADLPASALPLVVEARLYHRSRNPELARAACADATTPRARRFAEAARAAGKALDPCRAQPVTEIARATVWLGAGAPTRTDRPAWRRLYDHALGWSHAVQERLDEARPSLEKALAGAQTPREKAMVIALLAQIAGNQGRLDEALGLVDRAEKLVPGEPCLARIRGDAYAAVWRWRDALAPLATAAAAAPGDDSIWARLALAAGSAGDDFLALAASARGLALQPRDADLLRARALALSRTGSPAADAALAAYLTRRPLDKAPGLRNACQMRVAGCALERNPVHVHVLRPPGP